jgi:hypothetical protein
MPTPTPDPGAANLAALLSGGLIGGALTAMVSGFWRWLRGRPGGRAQVIAAEATYRDAITRQAEVFTAAMAEMVDRQRAEISDLSDEVENLKSDLANERAQRRQDRAYIEALRRELIAAGIPIPEEPPPVAIVQAERDGVTVFQSIRGVRHPRDKA